MTTRPGRSRRAAARGAGLALASLEGMAEVLERGAIYFFYRPQVEADQPADVQRLYLVLAPPGRFRTLVIGANRLPEVTHEDTSERRGWALVAAATDDSAELEEELRGGEYETETRGTRHLPPAAPIGRGRYALLLQDDHTELCYRLRAEEAEALRETFGLLPEACFIVSIKNPALDTPGFPASRPDYPAELAERFGGRRWIAAADPRLLDFPDAQLLLIGAHREDVFDALDPERAEEVAVDDLVDLDLPDAALRRGALPSLEAFAERHHTPEDVSFGEGSRAGGVAASLASDSASAVTRLLGGVDFPADADALRAHAEAHADRLADPQGALRRVAALPARSYEAMDEVLEGLSEAEPETFECPRCGAAFAQRSRWLRHRATSHPEQAPSAADVQRALAGVSLPATPSELARHAREAGEADAAEVLEGLGPRPYRDAAQISEGVHDALTGEDRASGEPPSRRGGEASAEA